MKTKIYIALTALLAGFVFNSCTSDEMETDKGSESLVLSVSSEVVELDQLMSDREAFHFAWTAGSNYGTDSRISYVLEVDLIHAGAANAPAVPNTDVPIQAGDLKYKDLNGDGVINDFDKGAIGKPNLPNTTLGWTIGGSWKGLSVSVLFQGSFNYSFSVNGTGIEPFKSQFQPLHQKRWTLERYLNGEAIEFPRLTSNPSTVNSAAAYMSDFWLIDAWYIRLKTIDVSYQVPTKVLPSWLTNLRVYLNAYNMFTWTSFDKYQQDPEIKSNSAGDAYMNQRVFNLGVQLTF
mgnify:CR=1 FL=1